MSKSALITGVLALASGALASGALGFGTTGLVHAQSNPVTTAPPERMLGTTTTDNPATATTPRPGSPAAISTPGTTSPTAVRPGTLVPGANSFTEGEARSRIQEHGFAQVSDLKLDNQGIWRGQATRDGKNVGVALDYQGNVVER